MAEDKDKNLWIGAKGGKVYIVNNNKVIKTIKFETNEDISNIFIDSRGIVWFSVANVGLFYLKYDKIYRFNDKLNIKRASVRNIMEDNQGNIWVSFYGHGVFCLNNLFITNYSESDGLSNNNITSLLVNEKGIKLVGTFDGLNILENDNFMKVSSGLTFNPTDLVSDLRSGVNNNYLVSLSSTKEGFSPIRKKFNNMDFIFSLSFTSCQTDSVTFLLGHSNDYHIENETKSGFIKKGNVFVFDKKEGIFEMIFNRVKKIIKGKDSTLWFGTDNGLVRINGTEKKFFPNDSVLKSGISSVKFDKKDRLWIAGAKGVSVIFPDDKILSYSNTPICDFRSSSSIAFDNSNNLWIGNVKGLYRIPIDSFLNNNISSVISFGENNGLPSGEIKTVFFDSLYNEIWIGTVNGLTKMELNNLEKYLTPPPKVLIKYIQLHDTTFVKYDNLVFKSDQNNIKINYASTNYESPGSIKYEYKFGDENPEWINTENNDIELASLSPGNYNFLIRAKDNNFNGEITNIRFTLKPPFTKTIWFYLCLFLLFAVLVVFVSFKRIQNIKRKAKENIETQNSISSLKHQALSASMNPHFIFNTLNSIQAYMNTHNKEEANEYLVKFSRLIRMNLDLAGQTFIPLETEIQRLELYLKYEKIRFDDMLNYEIKIDENINRKTLLIPNMILQPFVENSIWHGILHKEEPGNISINVSKENLLISKNNIEVISIDILDDGVGLNAGGNKKPAHISKGISLIKERLKLLAGDKTDYEYVKIQNNEKAGKGVIVSIRLFPDQYLISV